MSAIPLEILIIAFKHLEAKDLTRCQLVCKQWNQASVKPLYSKIVINTLEKSRKYVHTIKRSPRLGKYLEIIKTGTIFKKKDQYEKWDEYNLLETIINYCPNLLELHYDAISSIFWTKLMYAASQNQLPRLEYITCPSSNDDFDSYIYTILAFKKTINEIQLPDLQNDAPDLLESEAYPILLKNLNKFPCLQNLIIDYETGHGMSYFDGLINSCRYLTKLSLLSFNLGAKEEKIKIPVSSIKPNLLINTLKCNWNFIKSDYQLVYVMQKFPNLKTLQVSSYGYESDYFKRDSSDVLVKFLHFATNLQQFDFQMVINNQELITVWGDIINEKYKNLETIEINTLCDLEFDNIVQVKFTPNHLDLQFSLFKSANLDCANFLYKVGNNVRTLYLKNYLNGGFFNSIEKIVGFIQYCPSVDHLLLSYVNNLAFPENNTYRHLNVKSLSLVIAKGGDSGGVLKNILLILPYVKRVVIYELFFTYGKSGTSIIDIPNTSLDLLEWSFSKPEIRTDYIFEIYIRLKTNSGERFFMAFEKTLIPISANQYIHPRSEHIYLDITCKKLVDLGINGILFAV